MAERPARGLALVAGVGVPSAVLAAVAAAKPWVSVHQGSSQWRPDSAQLVGVDLGLPLASALALVTLAGWGVLLVTRGRVRRAVAVVALAADVGVLVCVVVGFTGIRDDVRRALAATVGATGVGRSGWIWAAAVGALLTAVALAVAVRDAPRWPAMGARYDAPSAPAERAAANQVARDDAAAGDWWKALDRGDDPTAGD